MGCVGHIERYNPAVRELAAGSAGELGEVYQISTRRQGPFPERIQDVGVILDLATHDIDLTSLVSRSPYADISVRTAAAIGPGAGGPGGCRGKARGRNRGRHLVNWLSPFKERVTVVSGERGCFVADTLTADLTFHANGIAPVVWETWRRSAGWSSAT